MKRMKATFSIMAIAFGLTMPMQIAFADGEDNLPPLPVLTAQWWQWAFSIPTSVNPQLDDTGQDCMVGQRGSIWFLAGVFGSGSAKRTCSVPEGAMLFFPVINSAFVNTPECGQGGQSFSVKEERIAVKPFIDAVQNLSVTVDGVDVKKTLLRRVQSAPFATAVPADNIFGADLTVRR